MDENKTPASLWITVILGSLFVILGFGVKFEKAFGGIGQVNIEDLISQRISEETVFDYELSKEIEQYRIFNDKGFNAIAKIENNNSVIYSIRMQSDVDYGNDGAKYFYELGRIKINSENPNKSQCSYKFKTIDYIDEELPKIPEKWVECSQSEFIKSISEFAPQKAKTFEELLAVIKKENQGDACGYLEEGEDPACDKLIKETNWDELSKQHKELLQKLRSISIEDK